MWSGVQPWSRSCLLEGSTPVSDFLEEAEKLCCRVKIAGVACLDLGVTEVEWLGGKVCLYADSLSGMLA